MDYEQKYKEALERARHYYLTGKGEPVDLIKMIFPEFTESEDERVRKMIINHLTQERGSLSNEEVAEAIAWVERQPTKLSEEKGLYELCI